MPFGSKHKAFSNNPLRSNRLSTSHSPPVNSGQDWLFVINSNNITSQSKGDGYYSLKIPVTINDDNIVVFSCCPECLVKRVRAEFLETLFSPGEIFSKNSPKAVVDYRHPITGRRGAALVNITSARVDKSNGPVLVLEVKELVCDKFERDIEKGLLPVMKCASITVSSSYFPYCKSGAGYLPFKLPIF